MIKILFIGMSSDPCGLETYTTNIFSNLQGKGFKFSFINKGTKPLAYSKFIRFHGGKIYSVPMPSNTLALHALRYHKAKNFFKSHHNFDIVHINAMSINELFWAKAARKYGIKHVIIQSHNSGAFHSSKLVTFLSNVLAHYNKNYINQHSGIIKLAATADSGKWMFGSDSNYQIVNIGMDTDVYKHDSIKRNTLKKKLGLLNDDKVIIITARMEKQKNYPKIIHVFRIMHSYDKHIHLVIIGDGSKKSQIKALIHTYHLDKFTHFIGEISKDKVADFLNIGDVMLIPSLCEAIPFSILEAQAAGVPVVASKAIPSDSNVTDKVKFLSLSDSNHQWAQSALTLLNNNRILKNKIKMNYDIKHSKFSLSSFIKHIKNVYLQIVTQDK